MANKPLKSLTFPGLSDTYTVPQVDNTLAVSGAAADAKKVGDELSDLKQDCYNIPSNKVSVHLDAVRKHDGVLLKPSISNVTDKFVALILQYDCYFFRNGNSRPNTYCVAAELYVPRKYWYRIRCGSISVRKRDNTELITLETPNATISRSSVLINNGGTLFVNMGFNASDYDETNKYASQRCFIELYTDENKTTLERVIYADQINFEYISTDPFTMNVERTYIEIDDVITLGFYTTSDDACCQGLRDPINSDFSNFPMLSNVSGGQSEIKEQSASYLYPYVSTTRRVYAALRIGPNAYCMSNPVNIRVPDTTMKVAVSSGDTFMLDDLWYKATTDLAVGDTLVVGTNCEAVDEPVIDTADLKQDFNKYGADNVSPKKYGTSYSASLTIVGEGTKATINGTQTGGGYVHYDIFNNTASFPTGITAGQTLQLSQECSKSEVHFRVYEYVNGNESMLADISGTGIQQIKLSDNATGCIVRLSMLAGGTTYSNAVSNFYIFNTLTKQQTTSAISQNASDINELTSDIDELFSLMPHGYIPVEFTPIAGLVNKWNETATPEGYAYASISVSAGEKYKANGWYFGGNYPAYVILNGSSVVTYDSPASTGAFNGLEITIPNNATTLIVNGYTDNPATVSKYGIVSASSNEGKDCVIVGTSTDYMFTDIGTAVLNNPDSIIYVNFGTYETEVSGLATDKKLIGKDRDLCVLTGTDKDYDTPPIEIAGGIVKNFTVTMQNDESAEHKGYCLHSDNSACANNTLLIENCEFTCVGQHSVGMGIYPGEEIIFKNCVFNNKGAEGQMPIYMHNSGASDGVGTVRFYGCYFNGEKYAMELQAWGSNASVKFEFIDCTCVSETYGTDDDCVWTDYVSGSTHDTTHMHDFIGKFTLLPTSHGNNVSVLNYSA